MTATDYAMNTTSKTVTYNVVPSVYVLYAQSKAWKLGSTIPIRLQLCDAVGANVSSPAITVQAISLTKINNNTNDVEVDDSGNANPDGNFRYDAGLEGYIFNLSTKGLASGPWKLAFSVNGAQHDSYYVTFYIK